MQTKISISKAEVSVLRDIVNQTPCPECKKRAEALLDLAGGMSVRTVAQKCGVCKDTPYNWLYAFRENGTAQQWLMGHSRVRASTMARRFSPKDIQQLKNIAANAPVAEYKKRAETLLEIAEGTPMRSAAQRRGVVIQTISNWLTSYWDNNGPVEWLKAEPYAGPRARWHRASRPVFLALLGTRPADHGYAKKNWSVELLKKHMLRQGCFISHKTVRRSLHRLGYRFQQVAGLGTTRKTWQLAEARSSTPIV
jgi:transposase